MGPLSHSGGKSVCNSCMDWVDCQSIQECILVGDLRILGVRKQSEQCSSGAGSRRRYLWKSVVLTRQWNFYVVVCINQYNNQEILLQLVGWHYNTPLGPCIQLCFSSNRLSCRFGTRSILIYTLYNLLQVECEALECLWIWWIPKCDFNTGLSTKRCSKKFLKFKELSARVITCWGFCKDFDVCVAILPCDCWATLYGCYTSICWFIGYSFVELIIFAHPPSLGTCLLWGTPTSVAGSILEPSPWLEVLRPACGGLSIVIPALGGLTSLSKNFPVQWWLFGIPTSSTAGVVARGAVPTYTQLLLIHNCS